MQLLSEYQMSKCCRCGTQNAWVPGVIVVCTSCGGSERSNQLAGMPAFMVDMGMVTGLRVTGEAYGIGEDGHPYQSYSIAGTFTCHFGEKGERRQ